MIYPDYKNNIVNIAGSIEKYFDLKSDVSSLGEIDEVLNSYKPKNVVVILFDGMGYNLINKKIPNTFLVNNIVKKVTSTCPSTTTSATTSIMTGKYPCTHGYLGWDMYYKNENVFVTMFTNKYKDSDDEYPFNIAEKYFSYKTITDRILENGKYHSKIVFPIKYEETYNDIDEMLSMIKSNLNVKDKNYVYAYYMDPDSMLHVKGNNSKEVLSILKMINDKCEKFAKEIKDTLLIITADHGHIDTEYIYLSDYPDLFDLITSNVWLEGRCCAFNVTDKTLFEKLFNKYFSKYFKLMSKDEVIESKLFGLNNENKYFCDSIGDFIALAKSDKIFKYKRGGHIFKSNHAGFTEDEMYVPLIMVRK